MGLSYESKLIVGTKLDLEHLLNKSFLENIFNGILKNYDYKNNGFGELQVYLIKYNNVVDIKKIKKYINEDFLNLVLECFIEFENFAITTTFSHPYNDDVIYHLTILYPGGKDIINIKDMAEFLIECNSDANLEIYNKCLIQLNQPITRPTIYSVAHIW